MSESLPTGSASNNPKGRFRDRKTRKLTRRYQESLEDREYSSLGTSSSSRMGQSVDTDDSAHNESGQIEENDDTRNIGGEDDGGTRNDDLQNDDAGTLAGEQQTFQDSGIDVAEDMPDQPAGFYGEQVLADDSSIEAPNQPTSPQKVGTPNIGSSTTQASNQSLQAREEKTIPEASALSVEAPDRVFPFAATSRKRKRSSASTLSNHDVDFFEYIEQPVDLDFPQSAKDPDEAYVAKRKRKSIDVDDHAHPSPYSPAPTTISTVAPGEQHLGNMDDGEPYALSRTYEKLKRPQPHSKDSGVVLQSDSKQSTTTQPNATSSAPYTTLQPSQAFEDDAFTSFVHADRLMLGSWNGTDGVRITLTDEPLSLQNCTINLLDLDRTWMNATKDFQPPLVDKDAIAPNGRTHNQNIDEAWQTQLEAYHVRGGNPAWEQWRRDDDPAWELCCLRDERAHQDQDPVPFLDPFDEILGNGGDDYAQDLYSLPITPVIRSLNFEDWSDDDEDFFGNESQRMRLRGGALQEPHGEMGLDANDLAAVETFVNDDPREESVEVVEPPTNGEPSELPVTEKPNGGPASKQPVQESAPSNKGKHREQRIMKSEQELVDVSRHFALGEGVDDACWCVGMQDIDNFGHY